MNRILILLAMLVVGNAYALPPCPPDVFHNCFGTDEDSNGKYVGEFKDAKEHGQGTYTFANEVSTSENGRMARGTAKVLLQKSTEVSTSGNSRTVRSMATVLTHGLMEMCTLGNGRTVIHGKGFSILRLAKCRGLTQTASLAGAVSRLPGNWY